MKSLRDMIAKDRIVDLKGRTKKDVLKEMVDVIARSEHVTDKQDFYNSLVEREDSMSTGIGIGLAVPHARIDSVKDFVIAIGRIKDGIEFDSIDDKPVYLVIMIGANIEQRDDYIMVLSRVCVLFKREELREKIINAPGIDEVVKLLDLELK